jgi:hypothetical protein
MLNKLLSSPQNINKHEIVVAEEEWEIMIID